MSEMMILPPEFVQHKHLTTDAQSSETRRLMKLKLSGLIMEYQAAVVAFYRHTYAHGAMLGEVNPFVDESEFVAGSDEQRKAWNNAGRQKALWDRLSLYNGEMLRRVFAGRTSAFAMMEAMLKRLDEEMTEDCAVAVTGSKDSDELAAVMGIDSKAS